MVALNPQPPQGMIAVKFEGSESSVFNLQVSPDITPLQLLILADYLKIVGTYQIEEGLKARAKGEQV